MNLSTLFRFSTTLASVSLIQLACSSETPTEELPPGFLFTGADDQIAGSYIIGTGTVGIERDESSNPALRAQGNVALDQSAALYFPVSSVDANATGLSFRLRTNLSQISLSALIGSALTEAEGGYCQENCNSYPSIIISGGSNWTTVSIFFDNMLQSPEGISGFNPLDLRYISFSNAQAGDYDIWLDDVQYIYSPPTPQTMSATGGTSGNEPTADTVPPATVTVVPPATGTGDVSNPSENRLGKYVDQSMFLQAFGTARNPRYTYSKLLEAVDQFPSFAACCSESGKKREIAAFMAQAQHEADFLQAINEYGYELANNNPKFSNEGRTNADYCLGSADAGCSTGKSYHGRGALQLTWNYNYRFAQDYFSTQGLNYDLWANPELVGDDSDQGKLLLWSTALWFWMAGDPSYNNDSPHDRLKTGGFGSTTYKITGGLECGANPQNTTGAQQRAKYFTQWAARLEVTTGGNLTCETL